MKERSAILGRAARLREQRQPFALATVVEIDGSTYRRPGARMLVVPGAEEPPKNGNAEPETLGTISGGCLEDEVARQALAVIEAGQPRIEDFDLSDDDLILGFGIGCDGQVRVLIEPILPEDSAPDPLRLIEACHTERRRGLIATVIDAPRGTGALGRRLLLSNREPGKGVAGGDDAATLGPATLDEAVRTDAGAALDEGRPQIRRYEQPEGTFEVLFEVIDPPVRLVVFGDGHDVAPVVHTAAGLGWDVTVVGQKAPDELADRFPEAEEHVFLMHPGEGNETVSFDARTAAIVMNHQYERDKTLVGALLSSAVSYVGALGPRERTEYIVSELKEQRDFPDGVFDKLHGPVGLDIGTETPEEIALAIVAEVQATLSGRSAQKLRERDGAIHERVAAG